jgi:hypothetical protein
MTPDQVFEVIVYVAAMVALALIESPERARERKRERD